MKKNGIIIVVVTILAIAVIYHNVWADRGMANLPREEAPRAQFLAPTFSLSGLDGQTYEVRGGERREKALLLNFWASWCGPCHDEAPDLVEFQQRYSEQLDIYGVNALQFDNIREVEAFVAEYDISFPILLDEKNDVTDLYGVYGFPTTFLIDRRGVITEIVWGIVPAEQLEGKIKRLLR